MTSVEGSASPTRERYEEPLPQGYLRAFEAIEADPNNELIVACRGEEVQRLGFVASHEGMKLDLAP